MPLIGRTLAYQEAEISLMGVLYRDEAWEKPRPGVLLIHGGAGLDDHVRDQAQSWATLGYVVRALSSGPARPWALTRQRAADQCWLKRWLWGAEQAGGRLVDRGTPTRRWGE